MSSAPLSAAIAPVLQVRDEEVFLGEEILFVAGVRAAARVDGLVVYARVAGAARPLRWLKRMRAEYGMDGALRSLGAPRPADGAWERITPSAWPSV